MTIEEYSTLMGYEETCPMAEYEKANFIYMMAGNMDKQTFCKEYKKVGSSPLVLTLADVSNDFQKAYRDKQTKGTDTAHTLLIIADGVRENGLKTSADRLDKLAAIIISRKECIKWKLSKGLALSETDNEYITDNLR